MTPYKSMSKWVCDRIGTQEHLTHGHFPPLQSMVCYDCRHLRAPLCHDPVSRDAWHLEKPSSPHPVLAGLHASPLPRAENLGRACPLDPSPGDRLALSSRAEGGLLGYPFAGGMGGPGSPEHLAPTQGWHRVSRGGRQSQAQAGHTEPTGPKRTEKRASALVFRDSLCPVDCQLGRVSLASGLSSDPTEKPSSLSTGKCAVSCHGRALCPAHVGQTGHRRGRCRLWLPREFADGPEARCG